MDGVLVAKRLHCLRMEYNGGKGIQFSKLAEELQQRYNIAISVQSLKNYEAPLLGHSRGTKQGDSVYGMRIEYLAILADYYGVSTDYLLGLSDAPTTDETAAAAVGYTGLSFEAVQALHGGPGFSFIHPIYRNALNYLISSGYLRKFAVSMTKYEMAFREVEQEKAQREEQAKQYQKENGVTPIYINTNPFKATQEDKYKSARNDLLELVFEITRHIEDGIKEEQKEAGPDGKH